MVFIILDIMLPKMSGFEVWRILWRGMTVPILISWGKINEKPY
jgi:DNA-binding response OmpR family regulator